MCKTNTIFVISDLENVSSSMQTYILVVFWFLALRPVGPSAYPSTAPAAGGVGGDLAKSDFALSESASHASKARLRGAQPPEASRLARACAL